MLPDIPGTEVCRQLESDTRTRHVPIVMLTTKLNGLSSGSIRGWFSLSPERHPWSTTREAIAGFLEPDAPRYSA